MTASWPRCSAFRAGTALVGVLIFSGCRDLSTPTGPRSEDQYPGIPPTTVLGPGSHSIVATADAYIRSDAANKNYGANDSLRLLKQGTSGANRIAIQVAQATIADSVGADSLVSAILSLAIKRNGNDWGSTGRYIAAHRVTKAWTEAGVTWNCAIDTNVGNSTKDCTADAWPTAGGAFSATATGQSKIVNGQAGTVSLDVTADVRSFLATPAQNQGWLIKRANETQTGTVVFGSKEGTVKPTLIVTTVARAPLTPQPPDSIPRWVYADTNIASPNGAIAASFTKRIVILQFKPGTTESVRQGAAAAVSGSIIGGIRAGADEGQYYVRIEDVTGTGLLSAARALRTRPEVQSAYVNVAGGTLFTRPTDGPGWKGSASWRVRVSSIDPALPTWALTAINAPMAWGCWTGDGSARIGVVDTDFRVSGQAPGMFTDVKYMSLRTTAGPVDIAHGAAMAGLLAARGNNDTAMTGVMWQADVRLYDMEWRTALNPSSLGWASYTADEVEHASRDGAQIINLSLGLPVPLPPVGQGTPAEQAARDELFKALIGAMKSNAASGRTPLMVISAGNDGVSANWSGYTLVRDSFPNQVIVVGGTTAAGARWDGSNTGTLIDVMAPAFEVYTYKPDGQVGKGNGTSASAALVSGIAGLLMTFDSRLTVAEVRQLVIEGARLGNRAVTQGGQTSYIADAYQSLKLAAARPGAPLCGNRVWGESGQVKVSRGSQAEAIFSAGDSIWNIDARHGGRVVSAESKTLGPRDYQYSAVTRTWSLMSTTPTAQSSGAAQSTRNKSHDGDSTLTTTEPTPGGASSIVVKLSTSVGQVAQVSIPVSTPPWTPYTYCLASDVNGCFWLSQWNNGEAWFIRTALSPVEGKALVAASRYQAVSVGGPYGTCGTNSCGSVTTTTTAVGSTVYLVDFATGTFQNLGDVPDNMIYSLGLAEGEPSFVMAKGGFLYIDYYDGGSTNAGDTPPHALNCTLEYRPLTFLPIAFAVATPDGCGTIFGVNRPGGGSFSSVRMENSAGREATGSAPYFLDDGLRVTTVSRR